MKNKHSNSSLLINIISTIEKVKQLPLEQWELLICQARSAGLLARLGVMIENNGLSPFVPEKPLNHLQSAYKETNKQKLQVIWEVGELKHLLHTSKVRPVLLKGAAYIYYGLPSNLGRALNDIDILVAKNKIEVSEQSLFLGGFVRTKTDDYDKAYYRDWTHEIPPLQHINRGTTLDVHHNIFPTISRYSPNIQLMLDKVQYDENGVGRLSAHDIIIHSATHLFMEGEFDKGLRDLHDIYLLLTAENTNEFIPALIERSIQLGLHYPIFLALRYCQIIFNVNFQIPTDKNKIIINPLRLRIIDWLFLSLLRPYHSSCTSKGFKIAEFIAYWRGHIIKMPLKILIPHLLKKSLVSIKQPKNKDKDITDNLNIN